MISTILRHFKMTGQVPTSQPVSDFLPQTRFLPTLERSHFEEGIFVLFWRHKRSTSASIFFTALRHTTILSWELFLANVEYSLSSPFQPLFLASSDSVDFVSNGQSRFTSPSKQTVMRLQVCPYFWYWSANPLAER